MKRLYRLSRAGLVLLLAASLVSASGCKKLDLGATVKGQVLYDNHPLPFGMVQFHAAKGRVYQSPIDSNGEYLIAGVPPGEVKVVVSINPQMRGPQAGMMGGMMGGPPGGMMGGMMSPEMEKMQNMKPPAGGKYEGPPPGMDNMKGPMMMPGPMPVMPGDGPPSVKLPAMPFSPEMRKRMAKLNKKYADVKTTGLTYVVQAGEQRYDIILKTD